MALRFSLSFRNDSTNVQRDIVAKYDVKEGIEIFFLIVELQYRVHMGRVNTLFTIMNRWRWFIGEIDRTYKRFEGEYE